MYSCDNSMPHTAKTIDGATVLLIDNKRHRHNITKKNNEPLTAIWRQWGWTLEQSATNRYSAIVRTLKKK